LNWKNRRTSLKDAAADTKYLTLYRNELLLKQLEMT